MTEIPSSATTAIQISAIVLGGLIINWVARVLVHRFEKRAQEPEEPGIPSRRNQRIHTLVGLLEKTLSIAIGIAAFLITLDLLGLNIAPLIAAAGIGGLALGFGAQSLVKDVIAGFFILLENQYDIGDIVQAAGVTGKVEEIHLRTTALRDFEGALHTIPNGEITVSSNLSKGFSRYVFDLPVPYDVQIERAVAVASAATEELRRDDVFGKLIRAPLEVLGVDDFAESQVNVRVYIETVPGKQWKVGRELRGRIKDAWDDAGISIPFPHREIIVHNAEPKNQTSPPSATDLAGD